MARNPAERTVFVRQRYSRSSQDYSQLDLLHCGQRTSNTWRKETSQPGERIRAANCDNPERPLPDFECLLASRTNVAEGSTAPVGCLALIGTSRPGAAVQLFEVAARKPPFILTEPLCLRRVPRVNVGVRMSCGYDHGPWRSPAPGRERDLPWLAT